MFCDMTRPVLSSYLCVKPISLAIKQKTKKQNKKARFPRTFF